MGLTTLTASSFVVSPQGHAFHDDPDIIGFYRDLAEPFGSTVDEQRLRKGRNVFHKELVEHLMHDEDLSDATADLVVVTHALPDVHPFTAVASHLNMMLGGGAVSFSISEQGLAAPFTALRIISAYQRAGRSRRAALAVLEQTTLPTPHPLVDAGDLIDSGVLLLLDGGEGLEAVAVESYDDAEATVYRLRELANDELDTLLVTGPWVSMVDFDGAADVHSVAPGSYCTSVWLDLARHWKQWQHSYRRVVLCDVDPLSGRGNVAILRAAGTAA